MTKNDIADALTEIATLMELKGENPFKVRAYQAGARVLEAIEEAELARLITADELQSMKGIGEALAQKDSVRLAGFGNFSVSSRPEREGRNPQTGAKITIKASSNVSFKAASGLKDSLN